MLKSKLRHLMADKKINSLSALIRDSKISRETLNKLYHEEKMETLKLEMIVKICEYFNCNIQDLIEYIPDEETLQN
ncbi:helix-turn-helix domain-containing protein [Fusobacterium mortiferum]|uniref:XRE family transcriptional regulator n=1 Tax=Fusobacterium mortiferum ATCC 9817 TaxID=469616 RepID=A0ABM6TX32_FUSMR|nr:helix-turn-helix transcriptional regulator [Fusobacterium mortiferum]AVQ18882.1 XRE family transcriptional regulator [Fusobacterium mortiferum ATCC 9817]EEO35128.1 hypothetical protein FMAG_00690 [Fusobacterium mortiferum ATCC 9817]MDY2800383.1 helix-turn-helix transcriptional regulator [Fusobacterium mortiferum]